MGILDFIFGGTNKAAMERRRDYEARNFFAKVERSERKSKQKGSRTLEGANFFNMVGRRTKKGKKK